MNLHLILTKRWYDETTSGNKRIEYRAMTKVCGLPSKWKSAIWNQREDIKTVTFHRAYTSVVSVYRVAKIDIGPCPIPGWIGDYYRIHFTDI